MMRGRGGISRWRNRRRLLLLSFAFAYITIGMSYILIPPSVPAGSPLLLAVQAIPLVAWGGIWTASGVSMVIAGVSRWHDKFGGDVGFGIGVGVPALWGFLAAGSTLLGASRGWVTAVIYWTMALGILAAAGMVDPRFEGTDK